MIIFLYPLFYYSQRNGRYGQTLKIKGQNQEWQASQIYINTIKLEALKPMVLSICPKGFILNQKTRIDLYIFNIQFKIISKYSHMNTNKFIVKLLSMMKQYPQVISWSSDGQEMEIFDIQRFQSQVHTKYFTTTNYQSFLRQLNMYSFKKMSKRKNSVSFRHSLFKKGNQAEFQNIKRRQKQANTKELKEYVFNSQKEKKELNFYMEDANISSMNTSVGSLPNEIRQTIALIKRQMPYKGLHLVERLEQILFNSDAAPSLYRSQKLPSMESLKQYVSFYKLEEILKHKCQLYGPEHNFEQNIFHDNFYQQL